MHYLHLWHYFCVVSHDIAFLYCLSLLSDQYALSVLVVNTQYSLVQGRRKSAVSLCPSNSAYSRAVMLCQEKRARVEERERKRERQRQREREKREEEGCHFVSRREQEGCQAASKEKKRRGGERCVRLRPDKREERKRARGAGDSVCKDEEEEHKHQMW